MSHVVIDPVTRVNGHLRVEVDVDGDRVTDAWTSGQMYRGIEGVLKGRDARDVWLMAQRICGTCGSGHALGSVSAVERALEIRIPPNARLLRNVVIGTRALVAHAMGFYLRQALDWVDPTAAVRADPAAAAALAAGLSDRPASDAAALRSVQDRLAILLGTSEPEPFSRGYWGNAAYTLSPEQSLVVMAHYFEALEWGRRMTQLQVILGGKSPHPQTFLVGGMALAAPWGGPRQPDTGQHPWQSNRNAPAPLSQQGRLDVATLIAEAQAFIDQVYVPDLRLLGSAYRAWAGLGTGIGHYLSFGAYPEDSSDAPALLFPRGRIMDRDLSRIVTVGESGVAETVAHAYYTDERDGTLVHPREGSTEPAYAGPPPPVVSVAGSERYSWLKAPRYEDDPMETGPVARILVAYAAGVGEVRTRVDEMTGALGLKPEDLGSTLGRLLARAVEAQVLAGRVEDWFSAVGANLASGDLSLADITRWDPGRWPQQAEGWSLVETAGGATGHWLRIADRRITAYQIVDGNTWNLSPRDQRGRRGALEEALVGTPVRDEAEPVEVLRTVHSFDPCVACGVH